ncbi:arginine/serine-rich protein 1 [Amphiprion ocellaris]|uniref:Arginine/serine-rich protein 1 n=1 Tax=Amphiprion ocellaris TaxID=80972 RepID=A0A3Q1CZQ9_AMPOC|nr:arginine/serine-rich protein 1 [Amphiprion ocellaris]
MAKEAASHSEMAHARQTDGINVIFDKESPCSSHSRSQSRSSSASSRSSGNSRGRDTRRRHNRSSSSSSSSPSSRSRSRSHPRCHRPSSCCRCDDHRRYGRGRDRCSPPRRYRAYSRSYSRSRSPDSYSSRRRYRFHYRSRSRSRSPSRWSRERRHVRQYRSRFPPSPPKSYRSRSRSRSSGHSASLSLHDKKALLEAAKSNAMKILGVEKLDLPESVKPILSEQSAESERVSPEPETRVRQGPKKTASQSSDVESDDMSSPNTSPKRKIISFSINNSVAKPTVVAPSCAKVTPRVDSYESRKPYGHWVPVRSGRTSNTRKHTLTKSH